MADHLLKKLLDKLGGGHTPGKGLPHFLRGLKGFSDEMQKVIIDSKELTAQDLGNSESCTRYFVAPYDLEITEIVALKASSADTAVAALTADGVNPLDGTNIDLHALTAHTLSAAQTLSTVAGAVKMSAGDVLKAVFTCGAAGTLTGGTVIVKFKPIQPWE